MTAIRSQLMVLVGLVSGLALLTFLTVALGLQDQVMAGMEGASPLPSIPPLILGLIYAGVVLVLYGGVGAAGLWLARKLDLPGIFRPQAGWRHHLLIPLVLGVLVGIAITLLDRGFASVGDWKGFAHPPFPFSLIASATAGIGEEIMFRGFVMVVWAFLLNLILKRWLTTRVSVWIGNGIAALIFAAAHIPTVMFLLGVTNPAEIPPLVLGELVVLNSLVGLVAGERFIRDGLVAAVGVHFWADMVWHVIWPLMVGA